MYLLFINYGIKDCNSKIMGCFAIHMSLLFLVCVTGISATRSKHTMGRLLSYIDDRLKSEKTFINEEFAAMTEKREGIENILNNTLAMIKEVHKTLESHHTNITKEIESVKEEVKQHELNTTQRINELQQNIDNSSQDVKGLVDNTKQAVVNVSLNLIVVQGTVKEKMNNIIVNFSSVTQRQFQESRDLYKSATHDLANKIGNLKIMTANNKKYKSCLDLYKNGFQSNGIFVIDVGPPESDKTTLPVFCDMTTDNGGWTVLQRRQDGLVDFHRGWNDYKVGFGNLLGEFWLGNEYINFLTDDDETHELRIDLEDHKGNRAYAKYSNFTIGPESTNYTLDVSGYTGDAGDSLTTAVRSSKHIHNGMQFPTKDRDNDHYDANNCASVNNGAWWFNICLSSHLNGLYQNQSKCDTHKKCIVWSAWKGYLHNIKFTEMKLR